MFLDPREIQRCILFRDVWQNEPYKQNKYDEKRFSIIDFITATGDREQL